MQNILQLICRLITVWDWKKQIAHHDYELSVLWVFDWVFEGKMKCVNLVVGMCERVNGFKFTINIRIYLKKWNNKYNQLIFIVISMWWFKVNCTLWSLMLLWFFQLINRIKMTKINTKHATVLDLFSSLHRIDFCTRLK